MKNLATPAPDPQLLAPSLGARLNREDWLEVLPSGMLRPKSSLLAVFGITRDLEASEAAWRRNRCSWCALTECGFRRMAS